MSSIIDKARALVEQTRDRKERGVVPFIAPTADEVIAIVEELANQLELSQMENRAFIATQARIEHAAAVAFVEYSCDEDEIERFMQIFRFMLVPPEPRTMADLEKDVERARQYLIDAIAEKGGR